VIHKVQKPINTKRNIPLSEAFRIGNEWFKWNSVQMLNAANTVQALNTRNTAGTKHREHCAGI